MWCEIGNETDGVTEVSVELLNDEGETARNLMKHCVAEGPVWLWRDLLLGVPQRHPQLHQRIQVIRVLHNRPQTPHLSRFQNPTTVVAWDGNQNGCSTPEFFKLNAILSALSLKITSKCKWWLLRALSVCVCLRIKMCSFYAKN